VVHAVEANIPVRPLDPESVPTKIHCREPAYAWARPTKKGPLGCTAHKSSGPKLSTPRSLIVACRENRRSDALSPPFWWRSGSQFGHVGNMDQAAFLIELADDLRKLLSRSAGQNNGHTLMPKASGCYGAHHKRSPGICKF
jgi:hypothetical protein